MLSFALTSCNGCSKSAQKFKNNEAENKSSKIERTVRERSKGKAIIKKEKRNGVY